MIWLCGGGSPPTCPAATSGNISGTITAANVTGPTSQGINPTDLAFALKAVREGAAYCNLHYIRSTSQGARFAGRSSAPTINSGTFDDDNMITGVTWRPA
jgi:hypothetical protein